jgi:hypothetical protein
MKLVTVMPTGLPEWGSRRGRSDIDTIEGTFTYVTYHSPTGPWIVFEDGDLLVATDEPYPNLTEVQQERLAVLLLVEVQGYGGPYLPGVGYRRNREWSILHTDHENPVTMTEGGDMET